MRKEQSVPQWQDADYQARTPEAAAERKTENFAKKQAFLANSGKLPPMPEVSAISAGATGERLLALVSARS